MEKRSGGLRGALRFVGACLRMAVIILACALIVLYLAGIRFYIVTTGSMEPAIPVGSVCAVNERVPFREIAAGDVISFSTGENMRVTHRAVRIEPDGIVTQGDANNTEDAAKVTEENYLGKTVLHIPKIGYALTVMRGRAGRVLAGGVFLLLLLSILLPEKKKEDAASD